jgi:hypothetical protein
MNKEFVPYAEALGLKKLGFDEPCNTCYDKLEMVASYGASVFDYKNYNTSGYMVSRPTFSQAFRWFREKHNLRCQINYIGGLINKTTWWDISVIGHYNTDPKEWEMKYQPYEEAELACLKKLIEIVK